MLNVNVGLLGHVDSGKTALAKALSRTASTAAFDKSPQSQSRGITLDLGFSACEVTRDDGDEVARQVLAEAQLDRVQCTLVDCPGHASLIRTVVGGAQIIDAMVLVIDATKGMQTQTAECLVLGEVLAKPLVVALNKVDAIQGGTPAAKAAALATLRRKLQQTFRRTRWPDVAIVEVAAAPRGVEEASCDKNNNGDGSGSGGGVIIGAPRNVGAVLPEVLRAVNLAALKAQKAREGEQSEHFYMLVDHCFAVRGQGTVFTGTVVAGLVRVGDTVLIPELQTTRRVKGLQVFHKPVEAACSGDRVGLCVAQFDPTVMERGVLCSAAGSERTLVSTSQLIAQVHKVRYHPLPCDTHTKYHITIGHATVMGTMRYFARPHMADRNGHPVDGRKKPAFDPMVESAWVEELGENAVAQYTTDHADASDVRGRPLPLAPGPLDFYAVLLLERPVLVAPGNSIVAMRLDVERENFCRIALAGSVCYTFADNMSGSGATAAAAVSSANKSVNTTSGDRDGTAAAAAAWRRLPVVRYRTRTLRVDRVLDSRSCIADGVVSLGTTPNTGGTGKTVNAVPAKTRQKSELFGEVQKFIRLKVVFEADGDDSAGKAGDHDESDTAAAVARATAAGSVPGVIDSTFGKTGKVKLIFEAPVFVNAATTMGGEGSARRRRKARESGDGEGEEAVRCGTFLQPGRILLILKKYPFALHSGLDQ